MAQKIYKTILTVFLVMLFVLILLQSKEASRLAENGLLIWFEKMIPSLLPFMILSGFMVRMQCTDGFCFLLHPIINGFYRLSKSASYVMIMGFLCGFPMGAKCVDDLYSRDRLSRLEARWLLAFCNQIGPVYFVSFAMPVMHASDYPRFLFGMYGIPLLYGLVLRYTVFRKISISCTQDHATYNEMPSGFRALNDAIVSAGVSILMLGAIMVLFQLLMVVPLSCLRQGAKFVTPLLEISGGLVDLGAFSPTLSMMMLNFGGASCFFQTFCTLKNVEISKAEYFLHKVILAILTGFYFLCLRFFFL